MASTADIWNAALSHVGASGRIVDPSTPDSSREAELCKTFYPLARRYVLEYSNTWTFATKRVALAQLANNPNFEWQFAYGLPSDFVKLIRVVSQAASDYAMVRDPTTGVYSALPSQLGVPYQVELVDGVPTLFTNVPDAVLVYIADSADPGRFSASFVVALSYTLASFIAGGLVKGNAGVNLAMKLRDTAIAFMDAAATASANSTQDSPLPMTPSLASRV